MMKLTTRILATLVLATSCLYSSAQDSLQVEVLRPSISSFTAEVGGASILDTYLTPIRYHGVNTRLAYEGLRAMKFSPDRWIMQGVTAVEYANVQNPAGNHTITMVFDPDSVTITETLAYAAITIIYMALIAAIALAVLRVRHSSIVGEAFDNESVTEE